VRVDVALVDEPRQHLGRAIPRVRCQPFGPDAEGVLHALDHPFAGGHLGLPDRGTRLHVHDDGMVEIDQVVTDQRRGGQGQALRAVRGRRLYQISASVFTRRGAIKRSYA